MHWNMKRHGILYELKVMLSCRSADWISMGKLASLSPPQSSPFGKERQQYYPLSHSFSLPSSPINSSINGKLNPIWEEIPGRSRVFEPRSHYRTLSNGLPRIKVNSREKSIGKID